MFDRDKKPWWADPCEEHQPHKPVYTPTEEIHKMRATIDRLLKFERYLQDEFDARLKELTSDNVIFKETYTKEFNNFLDEVRGEIVDFEQTVNNTVELYERAIREDYAELSADTAKQIEDNYNTFINQLNEYIENLNTNFAQYKVNVNGLFAKHELECEQDREAFKEEMRQAKADLDEQYNECKETVDNAVLYMKTNLANSLTVVLEEMEQNGELGDVVAEVLTPQVEARISKLESATVEHYGAVGDGIVDDTNAIKTALASAKRIVFADKIYSISDTITVPTGTTIEIKNAKIVSKATANKKYVFDLTNVENVEIIGTNATLEMTKPSTTQQACINIANSKNIVIEGLTLKGAGGDGIIIGGTETVKAEDVEVRECVIDNNRRNGISVIGGVDGVYIIDNLIKNTAGATPELGIDIETWKDTLYNENIVIKDNRFKNNTNGDITVFENSRNIEITGNHCGRVSVKVNTAYNDNVSACPTNILVNGNTMSSNLYIYNVPYAQYTVINNVFNNGYVIIDGTFTVTEEKVANCPAKLVKGNTFNTCDVAFYVWYTANITVTDNIANECKRFTNIGNSRFVEVSNNKVKGYNVGGDVENLIDLNGTCVEVRVTDNIIRKSANTVDLAKLIYVRGGNVTKSLFYNNDFFDTGVSVNDAITYGNRNDNVDGNTYKCQYQFDHKVAFQTIVDTIPKERGDLIGYVFTRGDGGNSIYHSYIVVGNPVENDTKVVLKEIGA